MPSLTKKMRELARDVHIIQLKVYKLEVLILKDRSAAKANLHYEAVYSNSKKESVEISLPVISIWVDQQENNPCKMHCRLTSNDIRVIQFMQYMQATGSILFEARGGYSSGYSGYGNRMAFMCDRSGHILRYGVLNPPYKYREEQYVTVPVFDSKASALKAAIQQVSEGTTLGGLDLINLALVKDSFMQQMGFDWVPDELGVGVSMWKGDVNKLVTGSSGTRSYGYQYEATRKRKQDFLDLLESALKEIS